MTIQDETPWIIIYGDGRRQTVFGTRVVPILETLLLKTFTLEINKKLQNVLKQNDVCM